MDQQKSRSVENIQRKISRRNFIKDAGYITMGTGVSFGLFNASGCINENLRLKDQSVLEKRNYSENMSYSPLGNTNLLVSRLSLGGDRWNPEVGKQAIRMGVNVVHGSIHYKTMESQAEALGDQWNKFWYILKHSGKPKEMIDTVNTCLQTIKKDHVEIVAYVIRETDVTDYDQVKLNFEKLKKAGKVRTLGVTVHTRTVPEVCREVINADIFDMILTMYQPDIKDAVDKELERAVEKNMGIMSMKTAQGVTREEIPKAIAAALNGNKVDTVLKRITDLNDLETYLNVARAASSRKTAFYQQPCKNLSVCGACGNCLVCPQHIEIQEIMRCVTYYGLEPALDNYARDTYRDIPVAATIKDCIDCGQCENACPRRLPIRKTLRLAHKKWSTYFNV